MKWFKHDSNASVDSKLRKVKAKYGMEGYGLYWYCLELIAMNVEKHNLTFELEHDAEVISLDTGIHFERVQEMMHYMVDQKLFEMSNGRITCLKMAARTDEYTQKLLRNQESVRTLSRQTPDKVPPNRIEENRLEQNKHPTDEGLQPSVWDRFIKLTGNSKSRSYLGKLIKDHGEDAVTEAVEMAEAKQPADPIAYISGILRKPPDAAEVEAYIVRQGFDQDIARMYVNSRESTGWKRKGERIVNWKPDAENYIRAYMEQRT